MVKDAATVDGVSVRRCTSEDVASISAIEPPGRRYAAHTFERQRRGSCLYLVAWLGGAPVGSGELETGPEPELRNLQVDAHLRSRGIGTALIAEAEREAVAGGARVLSVGVGTDNPSARHLYERLGYAAVGRSETSTYEYVDDDGRHVTATETAEYLHKALA